ncbi:MAG: hypothetical protein RIR26_1036 [Pseudomonadota bacterium]
MKNLTTVCLALLTSGVVWSGCGRRDEPSARLLTTQSQESNSEAMQEWTIPAARWCGTDPEFQRALQNSYDQIVEKIASICEEQNREERQARRFSCGQNECMESITTGTRADGRRIKVAIYSVTQNGAVGLQVGWSREPDLWNRSLPSLGAHCVHAGLFADAHFGVRDQLLAKTFAAQSSCAPH